MQTIVFQTVYTFLNNNTPHSEQRRTVLIRQTAHAQTRASSLFIFIMLRLFLLIMSFEPITPKSGHNNDLGKEILLFLFQTIRLIASEYDMVKGQKCPTDDTLGSCASEAINGVKLGPLWVILLCTKIYFRLFAKIYLSKSKIADKKHNGLFQKWCI